MLNIAKYFKGHKPVLGGPEILKYIGPGFLVTSSKKVMGKYANSTGEIILLWIIAIIVSALNIMLLIQMVFLRS